MKIFSEYIAYLKDNREGYWFKRKLYGWGWTPAKWQGWSVLLSFALLVVLNAFRLEIVAGLRDDTLFEFLWQTFLMTALLIIICYKTGESPRWQWGKDDRERL